MVIIIGDTFLLSLVTKVDGIPQDLTNWIVESSIGPTPYPAPIPLTVTFIDRTAGTFTLSADTSMWAKGWMKFDIRYTTDSGQIVTTPGVLVEVVQGVTP